VIRTISETGGRENARTLMQSWNLNDKNVIADRLAMMPLA